jgi:hypothetical protein
MLDAGTIQEEEAQEGEAQQQQIPRNDRSTRRFCREVGLADLASIQKDFDTRTMRGDGNCDIVVWHRGII